MAKNENLKSFPIADVLNYKIHGRWDKTQNPIPLFFNGSAIELNVTGTELWIDLEVDFDAYEPWAACEINDTLMGRFMLQPGTYSLCLFRNMSPDTVKNVRFLRELQAMSDDEGCHILIHGLKSDGDFLPVADRPYKLEFVGDSITSGEGTYGAKPDMDWISMYMSCSHTYIPTISKALNADYQILSQGGWGVYCGWDNDVRHNIPSRYEKICGLVRGEKNHLLGADKDYDFNSFRPDAIIVNLGTNDASAFEQPSWISPETGRSFKMHMSEDGVYDPEDLQCFQDAVDAFLHLLRKCNPSSHIVWVYGMLGYELTLAITDAVNAYQKQTGDHNVAFLQLPDTTDETIGSRSHPGPKSHARAAQVIIEYLKKKLPAK